jgi:diguanylate cyclase (GGDEF)-like protein
MAPDSPDHLTQLLSRAAFDAALLAQSSEATPGQPASLIMADVDHFKRINDGNGHQVGDAVLKELADRLRQVVKHKGLAYRYGGEEFAVILPNHTADEALAVAERARRAVEAANTCGLSVTSSYGVAVAPDHASTVAHWLKKADEALYEAKHLGRNLVRLSGEPPPDKSTVRRPSRKSAEPGTLSDDTKEELRLQILRHGRALCPADQIPMNHHDITTHNEVGRSFIAICPGCGLQADLPGPGRQ